MGRISFQDLKNVLGISTVFWISVLFVCYQKLDNDQTSVDGVTSDIKQRAKSLLIVKCGKNEVEITDKECKKRLKYLESNTQRNQCFTEYGVSENASTCVILKYLVYVERVCREPTSADEIFSHLMQEKSLLLQDRTIANAEHRFGLDDLLRKMDECGDVCKWMKTRIENLSHGWSEAVTEVTNHKTKDSNTTGKHNNRRRLIIILHMGLLTEEYGLNFGEGAGSGAPLGELVQWADLAAALHLLGHEIVLSWSPERLKQVISPKYGYGNHCRNAVKADIIYTDLIGLDQIRSTLGSIHHYRCRLRILDVFGTEPEFNHPRYYTMKSNIGTWGGKGLDPGQFFTQFPHTPDNSFMGFVVPKSSEIEIKELNINRVLLYGKRSEYLLDDGKIEFIKTLHKLFNEVHATIKPKRNGDALQLPYFVINHGSLSQQEFTKLLQSSKIYIGLGAPVEGPAALEAIANGVTFLNPKFSPPLDAHIGKPTSRKLTSQNPYAECYVGEPYVYTVDIHNEETLNETLQKIKLSSRQKPHVNHEFTHIGFLERLNAYLENQNFCTGLLESDITTGQIWKRNTDIWPTVTSLRIQVSSENESCITTCQKNNLRCERNFFPILNNKNQFNRFDHKCTSSKTLPERLTSQKATPPFYAPSFDSSTGECYIQSDSLLFSCACVPPKHIIRLCPCRTYSSKQIASCDRCT